jgi:glycosyltransferase involved in cell wall biosynthesis
LKSIFEIWKKVRTFQPDVIHVHYGLSGLFLLLFPWLKSKTIVTLHGGDIMPQQKKWVQIFLTKQIIKSVAKVIILNEQMGKIVSKINHNLTEIKCGVDINFFNCNSTNKPTNYKQIVFPADPKRRVKNYALFNETINYINQNSPMKIKTVALHNMNRDEIRNTLCCSDCMVMTSISEGSPQVIKEAMACNLPIVSVNVGDVKDILQNVHNCFVSKDRDIKELGELVLYVLLNNNRSDGRKKLQELNLDNVTIAKLLLKIYKNI